MSDLFKAFNGVAEKVSDYSTSAIEKIKDVVNKTVTGNQVNDFIGVTKDLRFDNIEGDADLYAAHDEALERARDARTRELLAELTPQEEVANYEIVANKTEEFRVTLTNQQESEEKIIFDVRPQISEGRQAQYDAVQMLHHPGEIMKYQRTSARSWSFSAMLVSRTPKEAARNLEYTNWIRSWVMPYYGVYTGLEYPDKLGAPPPILTLSAYGTKMIGPVPVVLESYDVQWPQDVDYIQTSYDQSGVPFPVVVSINLTLKEAYSPAEYSGFSLYAYKLGVMEASFTPASFSEVAAVSEEVTTPASQSQVRAVDNAIDASEPAGDSGDEIRTRRMSNTADGRGNSEKIIMENNYVPRNSGRGFRGADDGQSMSQSGGSL